MPNNLFFVESIYTPLQTEGNNSRSVVTLVSAENEEYPLVRLFTPEQLKMYNHPGSIKEGWYVYYNEGNRTPFGYGNLDAFARQQFLDYYDIRDSLSERIITPDSEQANIPAAFFDQDSLQVFSYHVNVGHGNCSFLLITAGNAHQLWMVDCSVLDNLDHRRYQGNIDKCLITIAERLGIVDCRRLHIDRFFLTHAHYDHYSGVQYLIDNKYIDSRTICYVNAFFQMARPSYLSMLSALEQAKVSIIEPISTNSVCGIQFLHPECRIYRSTATIKGLSGKHRIVGDNVNNSSVVVKFTFGERSMVFTGDLEQSGFKKMTKAGTCWPHELPSDYYTVSHHGSLNGHPTMACQNRKRPPLPVLDCAAHRTSKAILMGRNGAFNGIYSPVVTGFWGQKTGRLVITENAPHFVELEWSTGAVSYV